MDQRQDVPDAEQPLQEGQHSRTQRRVELVLRRKSPLTQKAQTDNAKAETRIMKATAEHVEREDN